MHTTLAVCNFMEEKANSRYVSLVFIPLSSNDLENDVGRHHQEVEFCPVIDKHCQLLGHLIVDQTEWRIVNLDRGNARLMCTTHRFRLVITHTRTPLFSFGFLAPRRFRQLAGRASSFRSFCRLNCS
jgi:hypothetical protein